MPVPVELLRFFDRAARPKPPVEEARDNQSLPTASATPALTAPVGQPANAALTASINGASKEPVTPAHP
jgi:hypothetical protein